MNKYLLLRDNKQTGPHTLDEIRDMGLKKYDLIWVEGKSAAWRYPGEIEEMKSFAPPVEEQPFDRFFRKPIREEQQHLQLSEQKNIQEEKLAEQPKAEKKITPRKYVSVTLPGRKGEVKRQKVEESKLMPIFPPEKKIQEALPPLTGNALANPLTEKRIEEERQASGSPDLMKFAALGVGIGSMALIAFLVLSNPYEVPTYSAPQRSVVSPARNQEPAPEQPQMRSIQTVSTAPVQVSEPIEVDDKPLPDKPARRSTPVVKKSAVVQAPVVKKEESKPAPDKKPVSLSSKVKLTTGDYRVNIFGGIDDLNITVKNNSSYSLDLVLVEVKYLKSNDKVFKTETLRFKNVAAGGSRTMEAPKTNKGIKVQSRITYITSTQAGVSENL